MDILLGVGLAILLLSNIWLLREHERTRSRLEQFRAELNALEERVYRMLLEIQLGLVGENLPEGAGGGDGESG